MRGRRLNSRLMVAPANVEPATQLFLVLKLKVLDAEN